jgi:hypothetical protein
MAERGGGVWGGDGGEAEVRQSHCRRESDDELPKVAQVVAFSETEKT